MSLTVNQVSVVRSGRTIVPRFDLIAEPGDAVVLRGPNGAGKTTLLRALAGLLPIASGRVGWAGSGDRTIGEVSHFVGHENGLKSRLTVMENLSFWYRYLGGGDRSISDVLARLSLSTLADIPTGLLSAGQKRRVSLARLLVAHRPLWFLDEPSVSLDQASTDMLAAVIEEHVAAGGVVLAATHIPLGVARERTVLLEPHAPARAAERASSESGLSDHDFDDWAQR